MNVTANLFLNVYGLNPINITLDLCNILDGALCPLPMYNFTGSDSISLPDSLGVSDKIPGIVFKIPDLEGFTQLTLTEVGTGNVKACVQATLSNGWSTHQPAVEWATGGIALAALLLAVWQSVSLEALAPFWLLELIHLYQTIATTTFLSLNYPSAYRAFTLNFAWAVGLFPTTPSTSLQNSINRMRHLTNGKLADSTSGSAVAFVNRKLSPYNVPNSNFLTIKALTPGMRALDNPTSRNLSFVMSPALPSRFLAVLVHPGSQSEVQTVTAASSNVLQAGIPIYVNSIHISAANAFMTVFICALILMAISAAFFSAAYGVLTAVDRFQLGDPGRQLFSGRHYCSFIHSWCLRLVNLHLLGFRMDANLVHTGARHILSSAHIHILSIHTQGFVALNSSICYCFVGHHWNCFILCLLDDASHSPLFSPCFALNPRASYFQKPSSCTTS